MEDYTNSRRDAGWVVALQNTEVLGARHAHRLVVVQTGKIGGRDTCSLGTEKSTVFLSLSVPQRYVN